METLDYDLKICVFCGEAASTLELGGREMEYCHGCREYKGIMTVADWEEYTGEKWYETDKEDN